MERSLSLLADTHGFALPPLLRQLEADGRSSYPDLEIWRSQWRALTLAAQPALSCVYDLEWTNAESAAKTIAEWLNPEYQHGRRFLPFAQTGAGDAYCLTPAANGDLGVVLVWHDSAESEFTAASFEDFAYESLVLSAAEFSHLTDEGFTREEARQCVLANVAYLKPLLSQKYQTGLERLLADGNPDALADGMITADAEEAALALMPQVDPAPFAVLARWECR